MEEEVNVLVTGGAGYIGSVCAEELLRQGHEVTVVDNLSTGHRDALPEGAKVHILNIGSPMLAEILAAKSYDAVFHFAAKALVAESMENPADYYHANVIATAHFLDRVCEAGIKRFVFSSSCAVYGNPLEKPITEDHPKNPVSPYGETKLAFERMLEWYSRAYDMNVCVFRYFNAAGATDKHGEDHNPETHILPLLLEVAARERDSFTINGGDYPTHDGTCERDYVHVLDIAEAHISALQNLKSPGFSVYNIGTGTSHSVGELIACVEEVTGRTIPHQVGPRREGDPAILCASPAKLMRDFQWKPRHSYMAEIIDTAWKWKTRKK
jgi:UDP-glucose 4-epimerase